MKLKMKMDYKFFAEKELKYAYNTVSCHKKVCFLIDYSEIKFMILIDKASIKVTFCEIIDKYQ